MDSLALPLVLSVRQPFASAIVAGIKKVENRSRKPPDRVLGERILIHASGSVHGWAFEDYPDLEKFRDAPRGAIIGSVILARWTNEMPRSRFADEEWTYWILKGAVAFKKPIPVLGKLNFWPVPDRIKADVKRQMALAKLR